MSSKTNQVNGLPKTIKVAFVSGGRESIAMVIKQGVDYYDELVFADTGDDPLAVNTNWFMEKYHGWKIHTVYSKYGKIREYYENKTVDDEPEFTGHAMPSQANKDCSEKFKIIPECQYLFEKYGKDVNYELHFGFSFSLKDIKRGERMKKMLRKKKIKQTPRFPLIEQHRTREDCGKICQDYMGFIPERSQCLMCFERTIDDWKHFEKIMPRALKKVIDFDESSKLFKKYGYGLASKSIKKILRLKPEEQATLLPYQDTKVCPCVETFDMDIVLKTGVSS